MARSWRNFFRRSPDEPEAQAPTATETEAPAFEEDSGNGAGATVVEPASPDIEDVDAVGPSPAEDEVRLEESPEPAASEPDPVEPPALAVWTLDLTPFGR